MKRPIAAVLAALLLSVSALPVHAQEETHWTLEGGILTLSGTGTAAYDGWDKAAVREVIFSEGITDIAAGAFQGHTALHTVTLPQSMTRLGALAFCGDSALTEIRGLDAVGEFDYKCLSGTEFIADAPFIIHDGVLVYAEGTELCVPEGVTEIGAFAFGNLTGARFGSQDKCVITLPEGVEVIGDYAFAYCASVTAVNIPESVQRIGNYAFFDCAGLGSLELGDAVESVGDFAFWNCRNLETLTVWSRTVTFGEDAYGTSVDWDAVMASRQDAGILTAQEVETLRKLSEKNPLIYDSVSAYTALHMPAHQAYGDLTAHPLVREGTQDMWMHAGCIEGIPGTAAEGFAASQGIAFRPVEVLRGDCDENGIVDLMDVIALNKHLLGMMTLSSRERYAADWNADGTADAQDSLSILRSTVHLGACSRGADASIGVLSS